MEVLLEMAIAELLAVVVQLAVAELLAWLGRQQDEAVALFALSAA